MSEPIFIAGRVSRWILSHISYNGGRALPCLVQAAYHSCCRVRLAEQLNVSERAVYRDPAELASQGARIEGEAGVGYLLRLGFFMPPLMLTEDEAEAVVLSLDYVDQRGDDTLLKSRLNERAKIQAVLRNAAG